MPVIIALKHYECWLDTDSESTPSPDLLQPYPAEEMEAWTVSDVGNVHNNDPELLALQEPDQGTLFSLFWIHGIQLSSSHLQNT
jgi:putative SOS response-associated peptidase YedK